MRIRYCQRKGAIAAFPKDRYIRLDMERLYTHPAFRGFALQDRKRLPSRFFARYCGAATGHLG